MQESNAAKEVAEQNKSGIEIMGISLPYFILLFVLVMGATYLGFLPGGMAGAFPLMLVLGALLRIIGDNLPIVKDYLGGGSMVVLFGSSALVMFNILPVEQVDNIKTFMLGGGFINLALAALIAGSVFGMSRKLLLRAMAFYLPCIVGGVLVSFLLTGVVGALIGYGFKEAIMFISLPIMGGGTSAGAIPLSQMYGAILNADVAEMLSKMTPAVALGNAVAIIFAGLLNKLGKTRPKLSGNGSLVRGDAEALSAEKTTEKPLVDMSLFAIGISYSMIFLMIGQFVQKMIPSIHAYAWMVIAVVLVKAIGILPEKIERSCNLWYQFMIKNFTQVLLVGIGVGFLSLDSVLEALSIQYLILVVVSVLGAVIGAGIVGHFVGFYFVEAAITGGLCMANMGGSGDIATLGAADRMSLMPFAAVSSRLGGSIILITAGFLLQFLY